MGTFGEGEDIGTENMETISKCTTIIVYTFIVGAIISELCRLRSA